MNNEEQVIYEINLETIDPTSSWIILGPPNSGKSTLIKNILYKNKHRIPLVRIVCGVPKNNKEYCEIVPPLFVSSEFDIKLEEAFIQRQKAVANKNTIGKYAMVIYDDIKMDGKNCFNFFNDLFKRNRHYNLLTLTISQYALDFPPDIRSSATYIAIFKYTSNKDIDKLYNNFASNVFRDRKTFNDILDALTGDYSCMIIKNCNSTDFSKCIFFYKCIDITEKFIVGCKEQHEFSNNRCDIKKRLKLI